jgi:hypothetical protein
MGSEKWTRENLAWLAGIVEGEGSIRWQTPTKDNGDGTSYRRGGRLFMAIAMTDEDVLLRVAEVAGVGKVYGPYGPYKSRLGSKKQNWTYVVTGADGYALLAAIFQWLHSRRREQVVSSLDKWRCSHQLRSLTGDQVMRIRKEMADGPRGTGVRLAKEFGVSPSTITTAYQGIKKYQWV